MRPVPALDTVTPQLDTLVAPLLAGHWVQGLAVGLLSRGTTRVHGYGAARDGGGVPDERTVFEIGSVTKTFTALALADLIVQHELAVDTPVQALLPADVHAPGPPERPMLLIDLATHLSGLPRMPPGFRSSDPNDPYADYHDAQLLASLRATTLTATPGTAFEYSNYGYGLLGWLLARHEHGSYAQLIARHVTGPLGMSDTTVDLTPEQSARFAQGHDADGEPVPPWRFDALAGAGALRSTALDMLRFVEANLTPPASLARAVADTHALRREIDEPPGYVAMGWHVRGDHKTVWHNGQSGGFHAYVAFDTRWEVGVVVLANTATEIVDELGLSTLRLLRGQSADPIELPRSVALDDAQLERYVGTYELAPGARFVITHTPGILRARLANQPAFRIHPSSPTEFRYRAVDASLTFELDPSGRAAALTLHQGGRDLRAPRVGEAAP